MFSIKSRNPNQSRMPWCYVRKGRKIAKEFCSVPMCKPDSKWKRSVVSVKLLSYPCFCFFAGPTPTVKPLPAVPDTGSSGSSSVLLFFFLFFLTPCSSLNSSCLSLQRGHVVRGLNRGPTKSWTVLSRLWSHNHGLPLYSTTADCRNASFAVVLSFRLAGLSVLHTVLKSKTTKTPHLLQLQWCL